MFNLKYLSYFLSCEGSREILFICKYKKCCTRQTLPWNNTTFMWDGGYGSLNWLQYHPPYFICLLFYLFILTFFLSFHPPPIFPPLPPLPSLPSTPLSKATNKSSLNSHLLQQQSFQLLFTIFHSFFICTVNNPYQTICAFKIISPIRSQRLLPTNIPNIKLKSEGMERGNMYIYVNYIYIMSDLGAEEITNIYIQCIYILWYSLLSMFQCLDIKTKCWRYCVDVFTIKLFQDRCLASIIKTSTAMLRIHFQH